MHCVPAGLAATGSRLGPASYATHLQCEAYDDIVLDGCSSSGTYYYSMEDPSLDPSPAPRISTAPPPLPLPKPNGAASVHSAGLLVSLAVLTLLASLPALLA